MTSPGFYTATDFGPETFDAIEARPLDPEMEALHDRLARRLMGLDARDSFRYAVANLERGTSRLYRLTAFEDRPLKAGIL